jgi:hypothetical protein
MTLSVCCIEKGRKWRKIILCKVYFGNISPKSFNTIKEKPISKSQNHIGYIKIVG